MQRIYPDSVSCEISWHARSMALACGSLFLCNSPSLPPCPLSSSNHFGLTIFEKPCRFHTIPHHYLESLNPPATPTLSWVTEQTPTRMWWIFFNDVQRSTSQLKAKRSWICTSATTQVTVHRRIWRNNCLHPRDGKETAGLKSVHFVRCTQDGWLKNLDKIAHVQTCHNPDLPLLTCFRLWVKWACTRKHSLI